MWHLPDNNVCLTYTETQCFCDCSFYLMENSSTLARTLDSVDVQTFGDHEFSRRKWNAAVGLGSLPKSFWNWNKIRKRDTTVILLVYQ